MAKKWLNLFFRYSALTFSLKERIFQSNSWYKTFFYAVVLVLLELVFVIVTLPIYLVLSPKKLQERGWIFPHHGDSAEPMHSYIVKRRISIGTFSGAGIVLVLKVFLLAIVSNFLLGGDLLLAATQNWDFNTPADYAYNGAKIAVTGGSASLVDQGTGGSCGGTATACNTFVSSPTCTAQAGCSWLAGGTSSTTNPNFTSNANGWTYADWVDANNKAAGAWSGTGGNPGGEIKITIAGQKNLTIAGYYYQAFTTTQNNATGTLSYDWSVPTYNAANLVSFTVYAFVDTASGAPTIGTEVASSTVTGTSGWATRANINISSKLATAGTHYVKLAMHIVLNNNAGNPGTSVTAFDNAQVIFTNPSACSGTPTACNTYSASSTCAAQGGCSWTPVPVYPSDRPTINPVSSLSPVGVTSWNSFTETATKNGGEIYYQLSDNDGANWKYWNGSTWATSTTSTNYNTAAVVNTNIGSFSVAAGKIMWKAFLSSNGSQQVSLDNVAVGYTQNFPPVLQNISVSQNTSSGYVHVNYNLQDGNSDPNSLVNYEYSLTGAFAGEQVAMTPVPTDPAHSGISNLSTSPSGVAHTFVWNAKADLGSVFSNTVYIRLRANDGIADSNYLTSSVLSVDCAAPIISGVTATQVPASSNVQIVYNLTDDTINSNLVELQVSADGGSNWDVPVTSVSGDVGASVSSGNGKTIIWQAGIDYANQEQSNMMVRVRAKDKYQNQGGYVSSASFVIDNRAPIIATPVNLLAQPLAGATTVLVGGSFSESNPDTNNFYVAINGGSYGSAEAGDTDTATPSDKSVAVGTTLKGNDYISAVKIEHTDDFGHLTSNANTSPNSAYKYVKPYTPPAPTINNPGESSLDVAINKNLDEVDGLEYAILENTQNLYVQSDGSLGASPYWRNIGTITVTGLSQPIAQYNFSVKSRNTSDASHAASSESDFSSGASSDYQSPQVAINSAAQTIDGTKYVMINYTGTDHQNQSNNLVKYEYSLNGTDWQAMTEKTGVGSDGISALAFTSVGASLKFAWDVGTDLPNVEDSSVYVRLSSNDSVTNSNTAVSPAFTVNTAGPVISNIQISQTSGTNNVVIDYDLADGAGANNTVVLSISDDSGATYTVPVSSASGDVGSNVTAGTARSITWNAGTNYADQENSAMKVKIIATDSYGNVGAPLESANFSVDTKAPVVSGVAATQGSGSALVAVTYNLADLSAAAVEFRVSADSGVTWNIATTTYVGDIGPGQTPGVKTFSWNAAVDYPDQELNTMRISVRALDIFGHQGAYGESADFSMNTKVLSISGITVEQTVGTKDVIVHYDLNKTATITLDISADSGVSWDVTTTTLTGQVGTTVTAGNNKTITWHPNIDFSDEEKADMRVRLSGIDNFGVVSPYYESADFSVDTAAPVGLSSLGKFASTNSSVTMNWSSGVADAHFSHYELWHGANQNDVINRSGTAHKWSVNNDASLSSLATNFTVITGISLNSDYYVKIWAIDEYGNETTIADLNVYSAPTLVNYTLEIQTPDGSGSTNPDVGNHTYVQDTNAQIAATASSSWEFNYWLLDGSSAGGANPLTLLMDATHTLKAVFVELITPTTTPPTTTPPTTTPPPVTTNVSGGGGGVFTEVILPGKPILTLLTSPTNVAGVTVSGLAAPRSRIDLYDNGIFLVRLDSVVGGDGTFGQKFIFTEGNHSLTAKAVDFSGNASAFSDVVNLVVDLTAPATPSTILPVAGEVLTTATPVLHGLAEPNVIVQISVDGNVLETTALADGVWSISLPSSLALKNGAHTVTVKTIDNSGNQSSPNVISFSVAAAPVIARVVAPATGVVATTPLAPGLVEATVIPSLSPPQVTNVATEVTGNNIAFQGTALPNQEIVAYVNSERTVIYRTLSDSTGAWKINHSQDTIELQPGNHTIFAVSIDPKSKVKTPLGPVRNFVVSKSFWVNFYQHLNLNTTIIATVLLLSAMLFLYRIKQREVVQA